MDYVYSMVDFEDGDMDKVVEDDLNAFAITAGAKMHKNFGLEAFYQQSKEESKKTLGLKAKDKYKAYGVDAIGYLPIDHEGKFEVLGSLGLGYYDADVKFAGLSDGDDGLGYRIGAGAQYNITENVAARVMARYVDPFHKLYFFYWGPLGTEGSNFLPQISEFKNKKRLENPVFSKW